MKKWMRKKMNLLNENMWKEENQFEHLEKEEVWSFSDKNLLIGINIQNVDNH